VSVLELKTTSLGRGLTLQDPISEAVAELQRTKAEMLEKILEALGGPLATGGPVAELMELYPPTRLPKGVLSRSVFLDRNRKQIGEVVVRTRVEPREGIAMDWKVEGKVL
jgi:hypothetical protein